MTNQNANASSRRRGQVIVILALMMVVLLGLTALAIDVSAAYVAERWQRSVADEAALAGAQSLQKPGTRLLPGEPERVQARANALKVLEAQLGGVAGTGDCYSPVGCELTGTPYKVSIQTPSPSCVDCAPARSMLVSIWQPQFGLTFGKILGPDTWTVRSTSVAGMVIAPQYGIVTLRPSALRPNDSDANYKDLAVTGGSKVVVGNADIATNSNATCSGAASGSEIKVDTADGFDIHHFGVGAAWTETPDNCLNPPPGFQVTTLVEVPPYQFPPKPTTPVYTTLAAAIESGAQCDTAQDAIPDTYVELKTLKKINDPLLVDVTCYKPGVYQTKLTVSDPASGLPSVALLLPGVYFFDAGVEVSSTLLGGVVGGEEGTAVVFKEAKTSSGIPGQFVTKTSKSLVALNFGDAYCPGSSCPTGTWATPALDLNENPVQTPEPNSTLMTVLVERDSTCQVESPPPTACKENENQTLKLTGGGNIFLAGVQFAPSDNAVLTGSSGQQSDVGAFWAWTLSFNGGTTFNLSSNKPQSAGVLRIDPACSPNVAVCNP